VLDKDVPHVLRLVHRNSTCKFVAGNMHAK
jgi:hypothetical protein